ncbi:hypothetical protein B7Z00_00965 [Candidatus Saccharibacteria bacterium 32-50-10]|nr:MAG: hypothetical protein B7Z00_00965 [Candidatus Saccharibacteria bacterium 32-50-10]
MNLKKLILLISAVILVIFIGASIYLYFQQQKNPYGDELTIANLDEYTNDKPAILKAIRHNLFNLVNRNLETPVESNSVNDVLIRDGTYSQKFNDKTNIHSATFIVDIESLKHSYDISYEWKGDGSISKDFDEWGTFVKCLPKDKLIYGDFNCKDMFSDLTGPVDPLIKEILPYENSFYTIRYFIEGNKTIISVQIMVNNNSSRTEKRFENYKLQAQEWLKEKGVNLSDYLIQYRNLQNNIVSVE